MINFKNRKITINPYSYMKVDNCFDEETLEKLIQEFPDVSSQKIIMGGRKLIETNTNKFDKWIQNAPTWKQFYDYLNNDFIFHNLISYYNGQLKEWNSIVSKNSSLKSDCFLHINWSSATDGYVREIHRDTDKRIYNFLIFLNDKDWEGGDFIIHSSDMKQSGSYLEKQIWEKNKLPIYETVEAKKNRGIFFLSTPNSYHSVSEQFNTKTLRKFIYGSYSYKHGDVFKKRTK